jgi:hypothetical protein
MKYILLLIPVLLLSCKGLDKCQRAERKISRLYKQCPELIKSDSTFISDTTIVFNSDTIFVEKKIIDSLLQVLTDTVVKIDKQVIIKRIKEECKAKVVTNTEYKTVTNTVTKTKYIDTSKGRFGLDWYWWLLIGFVLGIILMLYARGNGWV